MFNQTIIIGRLGKDPEMRYTPNTGVAVTNFTVAVNEKFTTNDGQTDERTTWFSVATWGKQAEVCNQYLKKGRLVLVRGRVSASVWTTQEGQARAELKLNALEVKFLSSNGDTNGGDAAPPENEDEEKIPF